MRLRRRARVADRRRCTRNVRGPGCEIAGPVAVNAKTQDGSEEFKGRVTFVDNAVDSSTGTIRVKAEFSNPKASLWPGAYVNVELSPRTIPSAVVVPGL